MRTYNVGDKVKLIELNIRNINKGLLPNWYSTDIFTIEEVLENDIDLYGYPIVSLKEPLPNCEGLLNTNTVTSYYLEPAIREERKLKLEKLNGSNM